MIINLPDEVKYILGKLKQNGFEGFVVGGCVRDSIIGRDVADWDITTDAVPDDVIKVFSDERKYLNGIKHGTVTIFINNTAFEITTYRIDGCYKDFRRPDSVDFSTKLEEDLKRRDFTINAMAYNEYSGLVDIFGGKGDIDDRVIRCVGSADERFEEDALRMLRAIRFASQLGFRISCETENAIIKNAYLIENISKERIRDEITKILTSNNPENIFAFLTYDLYSHIIPEKLIPVGIISGTISGRNSSLADAIKNTENNLELRLALLLHEMAESTYCDAGDKQYINKVSLSAVCVSILEVLRLDKKTINKVKMLIHYHDTGLSEDKKSIRLWLSRIGTDNLRDLIRFKQVLINNFHADCIPENSANIHMINNNLGQILKNGDCFERSNLALNGNDIKNMGYREGHEIGRIINMLLNAVIEDPYMNSRENLSRYVLKIVDVNNFPK